MTRFISHLHTDLRRALLTHRGARQTPEEISRGKHKEYPRMEKIALPTPSAGSSGELSATLSARKSASGGNVGTALSLEELGSLFGHSLRKRSESTSRNYPSGGGLYPIETYLIAEKLEGAKAGVFHYNPTTHTLERLWDLPYDIHELTPGAELAFSALVVFTAVWNRSSVKYGDFAYILSLLETGHMSENVLLVATGLGLASRPLCGFDDQKLIALLDLDEEREQPIELIALNKPATPRS